MIEIDVIILFNNEKDVIEKALESVSGWTKNIIILKSQDDNIDSLTSKYKVQVYINNFKDFSDQRNFAIKKAKSKWVLYLDADEVLTDEFKKELSSRISDNKDVSGYIIKRKTYYFGRDWGFTDEVERVFRVSDFLKWTGVVHETPKINGKFEKIKSPILHYTHRNLEQMVDKTNEWSKFEAKLRFENNHPPMLGWRFFRVMITEFLKSYFKGGGYKNGTYGLIESIYQSYSIFITYAKLWELQNKRKTD